MARNDRKEKDMDKLKEAVAAVEAQQAKEKGRTAPWMVGEQLKDMLSREPGAAELILTDLTSGGMSLRGAEAKIKAHADKNKTGNFACVTPVESEAILREYFGLGMAEAGGPSSVASGATFSQGKAGEVVNLEDFF